MSTAPSSDDQVFQLASGENVTVGDAPPAARPAQPSAAAAAAPSMRDKRVAGKLRARKVRRLVRHVEPWSVLKLSLIFYFCLWIIFLIAGVILWSIAVGSGTIDNLESFLQEILALESFEFNGDQIFQASALGGLVLVVAGSGFTVLVAVLFNLISDLTGGFRVTVVEEETARPRPKRTRPRRVAGPAQAPGQPQAARAPGPPQSPAAGTVSPPLPNRQPRPVADTSMPSQPPSPGADEVVSAPADG